MTTQELLDCVTTGAMENIQKVFNSKNKADYQKLKKLFDKQRFEAKSFDDTNLDILTFDWQSLERDRNWWWQLQALPFLNWYANSLALQSDEEKSGYFSLCVDAVHNWIDQTKQNKESPLAWHDHASALRARNLTNWLVFCRAAGLPVSEGTRTEALGSLIIQHLDWLQEDKHYSKRTNHGFDQAMIALTIGLMLGHDDFEAHRQRNRERLKDEVTFAFTDEGVHKENSPSYQKMMLSRLKQLRTLAPLGEQEIPHMGERYVDKAEAFLRAITLPNGYLPMIGDTRGGDEGLPYEQQEQVDVLDYSASGYVIIRGNDGLGKEFFMLLKNTHESNYHRHDDDMMIYLFYDGEVVLGDGGLYNHQEQDEKRKHLRSYLSHSVPYLEKTAIRKKQDLSAGPLIKINNNREISMCSRMFGEELHREIKVSHTSALEVGVRDSLSSGVDGTVCSNFFFEKKLPFLLGHEVVKCLFSKFVFEVHYSGNAAINLSIGYAEFTDGALVSKEYGKSEDAARFSICNKALTLTFRGL